MIVSSSRLRFTLALLGAACVAPGCSGPETREVRRVRIGSTDTMMEFHFGDGDAIHDVSWLEQRRQAQLATADAFDVFHDFGFTDRQPESGITFRNRLVPCTVKNYKPAHYDHGTGVAVADVDGDGRLDLYFVNQVGGNGLWRNLGGGRFEDITDRAGVALADTVNVTASFADVDNDGDPDLYVTTVRQGNHLFRNDGGGRFTDVTEQAGLTHVGHSSGALFFDYDNDGLLDLYLTNVGVYTTDEQIPVAGDGSPLYWVARDDAFTGHLFPERAENNILYRNLGGGRFEDVTDKVGLTDEQWAGDAGPIDVNRDGWTDLYVISMQGNDEYFENQQGKRFVPKRAEVFPKTPWGTMGIKVFDFDNDGNMDIFLTDMHSDMSQVIGPSREKEKAEMKFDESLLQTGGMSIFGNAFFRGKGDGTFEEVSDQINAENYWPWGPSVGDLNADGYEDAFVASSMNYPFRYGVNTVLLNDRGRRFLDSEFILGIEPRRDGKTATPWFEFDCAKDEPSGFTKPIMEQLCAKGGVFEVWSALGTRSSVIFDLDDDGDLDIVTNEFGTEPMVLMSDLAERKPVRFLKVKLVGSRSNRDGLGARVTVTTPKAFYTRVHDGQSGYLSHSVYPLYFGLDDADAIERVEVLWPSGEKQVVSSGIPINDVLEIAEP
jgi:hypothetical protein